jgi:tryptophan 2,3-dioxygenase
MPSPVLHYWDYLRLDQLLTIQGGQAADDGDLVPDELLFIVVHQTYELWFKMVIRELREAIDHLSASRIPEQGVPHVVHHLRRAGQILRLGVEQFHIMETLTPQDFLGFRDKLTPASGFQSHQLREVEILLGLRGEQRVRYGHSDPMDHIRSFGSSSEAGRLAIAKIDQAEQEAREGRHLLGALEAWLWRTPIDGSHPGEEGDEEVVQSFLRRYIAAVREMNAAQAERLAATGVAGAEEARARYSAAAEGAQRYLEAADVEEAERPRRRRIRAGLLYIESYRDLPLLAWPRLLVDTVVELEEQMVLFRQRHARMVERIIGRRIGTGGSSGVDYLDRTTQLRIFVDLWTVRTLLLPRDALPQPSRQSYYDFATPGPRTTQG